VSVVFAAIELQARDTLCALIDHGLGRTMHHVVQGIDAIIAHVALFASNHALNLRDFARAEIADRGVVKVFHTQLRHPAQHGNVAHIRKAGSAKALSQEPRAASPQMLFVRVISASHPSCNNPCTTCHVAC
jgi:hypothetical protein